MTAAIEARASASSTGGGGHCTDCTLSIPAGHVVGLVGPNGAGKTTLINLATGMLAQTTGSIVVLGSRPPRPGPAGQGRLRCPGHSDLRRAVRRRPPPARRAHEPGWDAALARKRIEQLDLDPTQKAGKLSGGQRAQLALTVAIAKRPELLILDEPIASLDPLARREFLQVLMASTAEQELSVVMSSHLVADLERVCDYLVVLVSSRVQVAGAGGRTACHALTC